MLTTGNANIQGYLKVILRARYLKTIYASFKVEQYYSMEYETAEQKSSRLPDYRTSLSWNPYLRSNAGSAGFSFFTSDQPGTYLIVVQGIDDQGKAGSSSVTFEVK